MNLTQINYFIFAGFCLIAAILSKRFIEDLYSRVIKAEQVAKEAKTEAKEAKQATQELEDSKQEIDDSETFLDNNSTKSLSKSVKNNATKIIDSIQKSNFTYRTVNGISKDSKLSPSEVIETLDELENEKIVRSRLNRKGNKVYKVIL